MNPEMNEKDCENVIVRASERERGREIHTDFNMTRSPGPGISPALT